MDHTIFSLKKRYYFFSFRPESCNQDVVEESLLHIIQKVKQSILQYSHWIISDPEEGIPPRPPGTVLSRDEKNKLQNFFKEKIV